MTRTSLFGLIIDILSGLLLKSRGKRFSTILASITMRKSVKSLEIVFGFGLVLLLGSLGRFVIRFQMLLKKRGVGFCGWEEEGGDDLVPKR